MGLAEVFAEERLCYPTSSFACCYLLSAGCLQVFHCDIPFKSFEYLIGQLDHTWSEDPGDSLVGDILMAVLGMLAVRQFQYRSSPWWQIVVHVPSPGRCECVDCASPVG